MPPGATGDDRHSERARTTCGQAGEVEWAAPIVLPEHKSAPGCRAPQTRSSRLRRGPRRTTGRCSLLSLCGPAWVPPPALASSRPALRPSASVRLVDAAQMADWRGSRRRSRMHRTHAWEALAQSATEAQNSCFEKNALENVALFLTSHCRPGSRLDVRSDARPLSWPDHCLGDAGDVHADARFDHRQRGATLHAR